MSGGRASKYHTHIEPNFEVIRGWLRSGYTEESIAKRLGVGPSTWRRYKNDHPEFKQLIFEGNQDIAALCVNNLVKLANGYDYEEIHTEVTDNGPAQGNSKKAQVGRRVIKKVTKHVPRNVAANIFLLCNRDKRWKHIQHIQHSGEVKGAGVLLTAPPMDRDSWLQFYETHVQGAQDVQSSNASGQT